MFLEYVLTPTLGLKHLLYLRRNQWKPYKELREIQRDKLKSILHHAYDYIPYYRRLFKKAGFKPQDLRRVDDIKKIPVTTKHDIKDNFFKMIPVGADPGRCIVTSSTGSTHIPLKHYKTIGEAVTDTATKWYGFSECGTRLTDRFVNIVGITRSLMPTQIQIESKISPESMVRLLKQIKPDVIYITPITIEEISFYDLTGINTKLIFSQGQTLTERHRSLVRSAFGLEVYDTYGSREFSRLAFECGEHSGQHMITDSAVMEFLDEEGEDVSSGEYGEVIVTGLHHYFMPLIRYDLDDVAVPTDERCGCDRGWPIMKRILGRTREFITLPSGRKMNPRLIRRAISRELRKDIFVISQYQIIQESKSKIMVKIIKGRDFDPKIITRIKQGIEDVCSKINEDVSVEINIVDNIPKGRSGKRPDIISLIEGHR